MIFRECLNENSENFCTGCGACAVSCPTDAIYITQDMFGYYIARFNGNKCIGCNKCENICPIYNKKEIFKNNYLSCYLAVQMKDSYRKVCSSGGFFLGAANEIISTYNGIVFGAKWEGNVLYHRGATQKESLMDLCGSKYVQSYTADSYLDVRKALCSGKVVLYCACPCQIAGLYSFLGKDYDNLYTIDLLCYYAPSIRMFQNYLDENYRGTAKKWNFRDKRLGWSSEKLTLELCKSEKDYNTKTCTECLDKSIESYIVRTREDDIYEEAYHSHLMMSEHCQNCKFNNKTRVGDITIGDLWGISKYNKDMADEKGTSIVIINSEKGRELFNKCKKDAIKVMEANISWINGNRVGTVAKSSRSKQSKRFYKLYQDSGNYTKSAVSALKNMHDIAIVGCWDIKNYGSQLTYYCLYETLNRLGYSSVLIGCHKKAKYKSTGRAELFRNNPYLEMDIAPQFKNKKEMIKANFMADSFIVGSDQIWNNKLYKFFGEFTLLDYIFSDKNKISYAASFGDNFWQGDEIEKMKFKFCLNRFNAISVRETSGNDVCKKYFNVDSEWVIDPIFLVGKDKLIELANKANVKYTNRFVFAYLLDYSDEKINLLKQICKELKCESVIVTDPNQPVNFKWREQAHIDYSLEDWLYLFKKADYVLTDSFHGMCLSLIFEKNFSALVNSGRGAARFYDYAEKLNLRKYLIPNISSYNLSEFTLSNINYKTINSIIVEEVNNGINWIKRAIENTPNQSLTAYDTIICNDYIKYHQSIVNRFFNLKIVKYTNDYGFKNMCKMAIKSLISKIQLKIQKLKCYFI